VTYLRRHPLRFQRDPHGTVEPDGSPARSVRERRRNILDSFDFAVSSGVPKAQVQELASLAFIERSEHVVLLGPSGNGKTHIAVALGYAATQIGIKVRFITTADLLMILTTTHCQNQLADALKRFVNPYRLLIIDEIGFSR
jgi:DNA replication protein DnaC